MKSIHNIAGQNNARERKEPLFAVREPDKTTPKDAPASVLHDIVNLAWERYHDAEDHARHYAHQLYLGERFFSARQLKQARKFHALALEQMAQLEFFVRAFYGMPKEDFIVRASQLATMLKAEQERDASLRGLDVLDLLGALVQVGGCR